AARNQARFRAWVSARCVLHPLVSSPFVSPSRPLGDETRFGTRAERLTGGVTAEVMRIGHIVRRTATPASPALRRLLAGLHAHGFDQAPRMYGHDDSGREALSFVAGRAGHPPITADIADWNSAAPGRRVRDVAYAVWRLVPLHRPEYAEPLGWPPLDRAARLRRFVDASAVADEDPRPPAARVRQ